MESRFRHIGTAGVRLLTTYLLIKLELVAVARQQNDWSYNHRLQRMFNSVRLLLKIHEMDISLVIVRTFEVRLSTICCIFTKGNSFFDDRKFFGFLLQAYPYPQFTYVTELLSYLLKRPGSFVDALLKLFELKWPVKEKKVKNCYEF